MPLAVTLNLASLDYDPPPVTIDLSSLDHNTIDNTHYTTGNANSAPLAQGTSRAVFLSTMGDEEKVRVRVRSTMCDKVKATYLPHTLIRVRARFMDTGQG